MERFAKLLTTSLLLLLVIVGTAAAKGNSVTRDLDEIIAKGQPATTAQLEKIRKNIEKAPRENLDLLLEKANTPNLSEDDLALYIQAIGYTRLPEAVDDIIRLSEDKQSETVKRNSGLSLVMIGGDKAAEFLFRRLLGTTDTMNKFFLVNLLSRLRYQPALPATIDMLQQDQSCFYDQLVFVFGRYGDLAVPFLLGKINDDNKNVRANAIMILGQWLIPTEAVRPLQQQFTIEKDPKIRALILSSLEKISPDVNTMRIFSEGILKNEKDPDVAQFAIETLNNLEEMQNHIKTFGTKKKEDRAGFERAYKELYESMGTKGDYQQLATASTLADEPQLKQLRQVILQRSGKECFFDYQKINDVIMLNRLIN